MYNPEAKWVQLNKHKKHPLKEVYKNSKFECKCCNSKSNGMRFRCDECDFDIHTTCGTCPASLVSFKHPQHVLQLKNNNNQQQQQQQQLPYHNNSNSNNNKCQICEKRVKGMVYRCKACSFYLHPVCSEFPEFLSGHSVHPPHNLKLVLMVVGTECDVCGKVCGQWRYFCGICDVHVHVGCLSGKNNNTDDDDEEEEEDGDADGGGGESGDVLGDIIPRFSEGLSG